MHRGDVNCHVISLDGEESAVCFALVVFLMSCECCVALPHNATDLSAVCDCVVVFPDHTHQF